MNKERVREKLENRLKDVVEDIRDAGLAVYNTDEVVHEDQFRYIIMATFTLKDKEISQHAIIDNELIEVSDKVYNSLREEADDNYVSFALSIYDEGIKKLSEKYFSVFDLKVIKACNISSDKFVQSVKVVKIKEGEFSISFVFSDNCKGSLTFFKNKLTLVNTEPQ